MFWFCARGRWAQCFSSVCCCNVAKEREHPHHCCLFTINGFQVKHLIFYSNWFLFSFRLCNRKNLWINLTKGKHILQFFPRQSSHWDQLSLLLRRTFTCEITARIGILSASYNFDCHWNCYSFIPRQAITYCFLTLLIKRQKTPQGFWKSLYYTFV